MERTLPPCHDPNDDASDPRFVEGLAELVRLLARQAAREQHRRDVQPDEKAGR